MCGIAGILSLDGQPVAPERLNRSLDALRHRGPDSRGSVTIGPCLLGHTRLAVVDIPGGAQPMSAPDCPHVTAIFNGEIYNHRELRRELSARGHRFATDHSDTEVLVHGYARWGTDLPRHLRGMFALALWDQREQRLMLARDAAGKKPLFHRRTPHGFCFASLLSALPDRRDLRIDYAHLSEYLRFGYTLEDTLLEGVSELPQGHTLVVTAAGGMTLRSFTPMIASTRPHSGAESGPEGAGLKGNIPGAIPGALPAAIAGAVACRLEADVPVGCLLSGGIDSALVAAVSQDILRQRGGEPLRTFCAAMPEADYDESPKAELVARHLGTRHLTLPVQPGDHIPADLEMLIAQTGEPTGDSSILPTYWLSRRVREHVTVALSGDGGDEAFAGYDRYRALRLLARYGHWLRRVPRQWLPVSPARPMSRRTRLHRLLDAANERSSARQYLRMIGLCDDLLLADLLPDVPTVGFEMPWPAADDVVQAAQAWDRMHYLPGDVLRKVDRASMAVALEVRCPLLDAGVVDLAQRLPTRVLMPGGRPKGLLRDIAAPMLPAAIIHQPKRGFALPIGNWLRANLREAVQARLLEGRLPEAGFDMPTVGRLWEQHQAGRADHTHRLFALWTLAIWLDTLR